MNKQLFLSLALAFAMSLSVSTSAESPPTKDFSIVESKIEQLPVAEITPMEILTITPHEFALVAHVEFMPVCQLTEVKRQPIVHSVCDAAAPIRGVDGHAVLNWLSSGAINIQTSEVAFRYVKSRATEYRC